MSDQHRVSEPAQTLAYGFSFELKEQDFATAITLVSEALKADGFGVLNDVHVQAMMLTKLGVEGRPYQIIGACNPSMAHQALQLPCNVVVCVEADGRLVVGFMDPMAVLQMLGNSKVALMVCDGGDRMGGARGLWRTAPGTRTGATRWTSTQATTTSLKQTLFQREATPGSTLTAP